MCHRSISDILLMISPEFVLHRSAYRRWHCRCHWGYSLGIPFPARHGPCGTPHRPHCRRSQGPRGCPQVRTIDLRHQRLCCALVHLPALPLRRGSCCSQFTSPHDTAATNSQCSRRALFPCSMPVYTTTLSFFEHTIYVLRVPDVVWLAIGSCWTFLSRHHSRPCV